MTNPALLVRGPIELRVTRWRCPHCPRSWSSRARTFDHIARCWRNPALRCCKTCQHFTPYEPAIDYPEHCDVGVPLNQIDGGGTSLVTNCDSWAAAA